MKINIKVIILISENGISNNIHRVEGTESSHGYMKEEVEEEKENRGGNGRRREGAESE